LVKRNLLKHSVLFARHVLPAAVRPARTLWNEMIGFLFGVFAVAAAYYCVRAVLDSKGDPGSFVRVILSGIFFIVMAYYGISSFLKARRISRS
jgi:hypothetical protein